MLNYKESKNRGTFDFPLEFYHINTSHPRYIMDYHWHLENEVIRILEGELLVTLNQEKFLAKKGDIIFINSSVLHSAVPTNCTYECIVVDLSFLANENRACRDYVDRLANTAVLINEHIRGEDNIPLYQTVWQLFDTIHGRQEAYQVLALGMLYQMVGLIFNSGLYHHNPLLNSAHDQRNIRNLKKVLVHIQKSYDTPITLQEMADIAQMSPKYFCCYFKSMTCKSPIEYLNYYRIESAAHMLRSTDAPITEIAYSCGFNDLSYFIKTFKRYKQTTPRCFRTNFII